MKLVKIPDDMYDDYRLDIIFNGYKWDPQFLDNNTIAKHVLVLSVQEHEALQKLVVALGKETQEAERLIHTNPKLVKKLALPRKIRNDLSRMDRYDPDKHIRLMRFDFHPTVDGTWKISEVNSDVPGGFAEASLMPMIAKKALSNDKFQVHAFHDVFIPEIMKKVPSSGTIMMVHCTSYTDDRQVMQFLGDSLKRHGYSILYGAADHVRFDGNKATSILDNHEGKIDAIIRFNPMEWVIDIKPKHWGGYFDTLTPSCNHPIAIYTQSKKFPLIWNDLESLGVSICTWRSLLPETRSVSLFRHDEKFIYKPVWGRVGEGISIKEACKEDEYQKIMRDVKWHPRKYIQQQKFNSLPLLDDTNQEFHVCIGAYYVNGKSAGYYCRMSSTPRIDSHAADIAVLIEGD